MPIPSYATLSNRKLIIPSPKTSYTAVENHFFYDVMSHVIAGIRIDEEWYLTTYPDIAVAIREGVIQDVRTHYTRFGFFEHRLPYQISIDEQWYRTQYPDVNEAVKTGMFPDAQTHFDMVGFREGRFPFAGFVFDAADPF